MPINTVVSEVILEEIVQEIITGSYLLNDNSQFIPLKDIDKLSQKQIYPFTTAVSSVVTFNRETETANLLITTVLHKPKQLINELEHIYALRLTKEAKPYVLSHIEIVDWLIGRFKPVDTISGKKKQTGKWNFDPVGDAQTQIFYSEDDENKDITHGKFITVITSVTFQDTRGSFCCSQFNVTE